MRRIIILLLAALVVVAACSKAEYNGNILPGLYVYNAGGNILAIGTEAKDGWSAETDCEAGYINVMDAQSLASIFKQTKGIEILSQDGYSGWGYSNGFRILCVPASSNRFTGRVLSQPTDWNLPETMDFKRR